MDSADTDTTKTRGWPEDVTFVHLTAVSSLMHLRVTVGFPADKEHFGSKSDTFCIHENWVRFANSTQSN